MDQDRQIRFLISPFFLYASLAWYAYVDPCLHDSLASLKLGDLKDILSIALAAGAATIPIGFSIGTLGLCLLKGFFYLRSRFRGLRQIYEVSISEECFQTMLRETRAAKEDRRSLLYAAVTFDHELLPEGVHKWLLRRWNSFNVAFNSAIAIAISFVAIPLRWLYPCSQSQLCYWSIGKMWWLATNIALLCLLSFAAWFAHDETMGMVEFQSRRANVYELKKRK